MLKAGTPFTGTMTQPSFLVGNEEESRTFILDLGGLPKDSTASVSADISWTIVANDFDLHLTAGDDDIMTDGYQPIDDAVESASAGNVPNCGEITVGVADFLAPVVAGDTITLNLGVSVY